MVAIDRGEGPVVVLIHGLGANHEDWRHVVPLLAEDHRVLAVDLPGFGKTPPLLRPTGVADYADAVWQAMDHAGVNSLAAIVGPFDGRRRGHRGGLASAAAGRAFVRPQFDARLQTADARRSF